MKFINKRTDVILEPRSQMVEDQLRKSADYAPYEPQKAADGGDKLLAKMRTRLNFWKPPMRPELRFLTTPQRSRSSI